MKLRSIIFFVAVSAIANAQAPVWQWAKKSIGASGEYPQCVSVDANGDVYMVGSFDSPTCTFGSVTLTRIGIEDVFVVKYDAAGNVLWAKNAGGSGGIGTQAALGITSDPAGNAYMTGYFDCPSIVFGTHTLTNFSATKSDFFVVKYGPSGNVIWARSAGGSDYEQANSISADTSGNIYVAGQFASTSMAVGSYTLTNTTINSNVFVVKYDSSGTVKWVRSAGGINGDHASSVVAGKSGIYVTGSFQSTSITFGSVTLTNAGTTYDGFVVKYSAQGTALWAKDIGGSNDEYSNGVATDLQENVYVTGYFLSSALAIGTNTITNTNSGGSDIFVIKYDSTGAPKWAKNAGGNNGEYGNGVTVDKSGSVYVIGSFQSTIIVFNNDTLGNANSVAGDVFLLKYDSAGNPVWAIEAGGINPDYGTGVTHDAGGNIYVMGHFRSSAISFGNLTLTNTAAGVADAFLAKFDRCAAVNAPLCMVTVDSLSQNNIIIWDKTGLGSVDSFIVYREIGTNNYKRIGVVPHDSLSMLVDTVRYKYFPNTGDPNGGTYRYKIQTHDTCGNYSALSPFHNTIFMIGNNGTFSWSQLYTIEGAPNPVNSYELWRDDLNTGTGWHAVNSVSGTQQNVNDVAYATYAATANWRIQTNWTLSCTPTYVKDPVPMGTVKTTKSNTFKTAAPGAVDENAFENMVIVYPNPSSGNFTVVLAGVIQGKHLSMYNMIGQLMYSEVFSEAKKEIVIDVPKGIYQLQVETDLGMSNKKIVIQ